MGMLDEQRDREGMEEKVQSFAWWVRVAGYLQGTAVFALLCLGFFLGRDPNAYFLIGAVVNAALIPIIFGRANEAEAVGAMETRSIKLAKELAELRRMVGELHAALPKPAGTEPVRDLKA